MEEKGIPPKVKMSRIYTGFGSGCKLAGGVQGVRPPCFFLTLGPGTEQKGHQAVRNMDYCRNGRVRNVRIFRTLCE